jgi:hypothetical protein
MDDVTQVVMSESQRELLEEVQVQYARKMKQFTEAGGDPSKRKGNLTCHLPWEMCREAFEGEPPSKEEHV